MTINVEVPDFLCSALIQKPDAYVGVLILSLGNDVSESEDRSGRLGRSKHNFWAINVIDAQACEKFLGGFVDEQNFTSLAHDNSEILVLIKELLKKSLLQGNHAVFYGNCDEILLIEPGKQAAKPD